MGKESPGCRKAISALYAALLMPEKAGRKGVLCARLRELPVSWMLGESAIAVILGTHRVVVPPQGLRRVESGK